MPKKLSFFKSKAGSATSQSKSKASNSSADVILINSKEAEFDSEIPFCNEDVKKPRKFSLDIRTHSTVDPLSSDLVRASTTEVSVRRSSSWQLKLYERGFLAVPKELSTNVIRNRHSISACSGTCAKKSHQATSHRQKESSSHLKSVKSNHELESLSKVNHNSPNLSSREGSQDKLSICSSTPSFIHYGKSLFVQNFLFTTYIILAASIKSSDKLSDYFFFSEGFAKVYDFECPCTLAFYLIKFYFYTIITP